jgi:hypothetical protein
VVVLEEEEEVLQWEVEEGEPRMEGEGEGKKVLSVQKDATVVNLVHDLLLLVVMI